VRAEDIEYTLDGQRYLGHMAVPDGDDARPGVLVCHEGFGLDIHAKGRAERLADELGVVAFALDYYGDGKPIPPDQLMDRMGPLAADPERIRRVGRAGLEVLLAQPRVDRSRVAAIGYCFGGTMSLELARGGEALAAVVGFHSGLSTGKPAAPGTVRARVLVCIGADDSLIPAEQRAAFETEMREAGCDWQLHLYGGAAHSFTNPAADGSVMPDLRYNQPADERSWQEMLNLFQEVSIVS
jgi:dienelactone hydrolase